MEWLVASVVLIAVILGPLAVLAWLQRRVEVVAQPAAHPAPAELPKTPTWTSIEAGDRIVWEGSTHTVATVVHCREERGHRVLGWIWLMLDDDRLLEYRAREIRLFDPPVILPPDSPEFAALAGRQGVLSRFERRGQVSWDPARFTWDGIDYLVVGTGAFIAWSDTPIGERPVWSQISPNADDNLFFALERPGEEQDPEADPSTLVLGVWTDAIALYRCRRAGAASAAELDRPVRKIGGEPLTYGAAGPILETEGQHPQDHTQKGGSGKQC